MSSPEEPRPEREVSAERLLAEMATHERRRRKAVLGLGLVTLVLVVVSTWLAVDLIISSGPGGGTDPEPFPVPGSDSAGYAAAPGIGLILVLSVLLASVVTGLLRSQRHRPTQTDVRAMRTADAAWAEIVLQKRPRTNIFRPGEGRA
ncbi:hypothetical protein OG394_38665 [Kribbella sp. NBC_01245]|uniref:hypothetical protein n=1 Tax=Kribbella sp. NBC_01245 TaxID=2903578 RepID=UPI002E2AFFEA|nr:hypothetical protein [Kribbella sp. NBC_01245]